MEVGTRDWMLVCLVTWRHGGFSSRRWRRDHRPITWRGLWSSHWWVAAVPSTRGGGCSAVSEQLILSRRHTSCLQYCRNRIAQNVDIHGAGRKQRKSRQGTDSAQCMIDWVFNLRDKVLLGIPWSLFDSYLLRPLILLLVDALSRPTLPHRPPPR